MARIPLYIAIIIALVWFPVCGIAQEATSEVGAPSENAADAATDVADLQAPADVEIEPLAEDDEIANRLQNILEATTWFSSPRVRVDEGVVFLSGIAQTQEHKTWAGNLGRSTQDVVAVVNRIEVTERSMWDLSPAWKEIRSLGRESIQVMPLVGLAILLMIASGFFARFAVRASRALLNRRMSNRLLVSVLSRAVAIPVLLFGLYLALRVSGLTQIAATVLGGTGLFGLIIGIAFRDIAENFLASILISIQKPFALGDQIEVAGEMGIVQSVTARGTLLMTMEGNHVQIPNSSIYKSVIRNLTANPNQRCDFLIGISFGDSIAAAQQIVLDVLNNHTAVLHKPEPIVLVEELGAATVNLRIYFWFNNHEHSKLKVRSSVIRLSKLAIEAAGLTMPDEAREIIFPQEVPVRIRSEESATSASTSGESTNGAAVQIHAPQAALHWGKSRESVDAVEDDLTSECDDIHEQAKNSRSPEEGENLLAP